MPVLPLPPNADTLKKQEKKIEKTMKTQSISKIKYKIKADNNKEIIDLKKIKVNVDNDDVKTNIKPEDGSLKVDIKDGKQKADEDVIVLGQQPMHPQGLNRTQKTKR